MGGARLERAGARLLPAARRRRDGRLDEEPPRRRRARGGGGARMKRPLTIVAAVAENGVIGRDNKLIWRLRTDLRRFRDLTWGKPMIMGRKTFDSIGKALPGRRTVVVTRDRGFAADGGGVAHRWPQG